TSIPLKWGPDEGSIRKPNGWSNTVVSDIYMFVSDQKPSDQNDKFVPRIHFFSVENPTAQPSDKLGWVKQELEKLANTPDAFENKTEGGMGQLKQVRGGFDVEWTTLTRRTIGKEVKAIKA